ncbi:MAG: serine/threonine-protein kinase, partial [Actinomycetota bacterium]
MSESELGIANLTDLVPIAHGGFSVVYAATNTQFDRRVAVKVLNRLTSEADQRRFERECRIMGRLSTHRNVVTVYNAGYTNDGRPYIEMELIDGGTLAEWVKVNGRIPWPQAVEQIVAVGIALGEAHDAEILHRDVKPENILLAGNEPRLTDFGIAYLRDSTGATSTHLSASWLHSPPETFDNRRDERSDIYSLGSTLHTIITGTPPFWRSNDESLSPLMYRLLNEPAPRIPDELAPAPLADFVVQTLAKNPDERPQTAAEFVANLQRFLSPAAGGAGEVGPVGRTRSRSGLRWAGRSRGRRR